VSNTLSRAYLAGVLVPLLVLGYLVFGGSLHAERGGVLLGVILVILPLFALVGAGVLFRRAYVNHKRLLESASLLRTPQTVRGPFGLTYMVRGLLDGRSVCVSIDRVEIDAEPPRHLRLAAAEGLLAASLGHGDFGSRDDARSAAARLLARGVLAVETRAGKVVVEGGSGSIQERVEDAMLVAMAPALIRSREPGGRDCPYCHQALGSVLQEAAMRCPACEVVHHAECWSEHGGCAVHRCERSPREGRERGRERAQVPSKQ
jgi:hypothetical protein